jgi:hypothetical protein
LRSGQGENFGAPGKSFLLASGPFFVFLPTLQRYDIAIAVHEYLSRFFKKFLFQVSSSKIQATT